MEKCAEAVVNWMIGHNVINKEEKVIYKYALRSVALWILPLFLAAGIGGCLGNIKDGIILVLPFMILRKFSGGYHAKNFYCCAIGSGLLLFLCIMLAIQIKFDWKLLVVTAIASICLVLFSPIDSENRQLDAEEKNRFRKMTVYLTCLLDGIGILIFLFGYCEYAVCFYIGIQMAAGLQIPCIVKGLHNDQKTHQNVV